MRIGDNFSNRIIKYYRIKSEVLPNVVIKKKTEIMLKFGIRNH